jgi:formate hydrogenlyase transcriptional activator
LELQPKLLRVLEGQEFERLGSTYTRRADVIERAVILTKSDALEIPILFPWSPIRREPVTLMEAERAHILKALDDSDWVVGGKSGAAARLDVPRTTLISKMRKRGLHRAMVRYRV